jgi:hypothetical protein
MQRNRINNVKIVWSFLIISFIILFSQNAFADLYLNSKAGYINLNTTGQTRMQITPGGNFNLLGLANVSIPGNLSVGGNVSVDGSTLFVDSESNRVGIGTTRPNANLHVDTGNAVGDATNPAIQIGGTTTYRLGFYTTTEGGVIDAANGDDGLAFHTKTAGEAMRITSAGNVGIGTIDPTYELELNGSENSDITVAARNINSGGTSAKARFLGLVDGGNGEVMVTSTGFTDIANGADALIIGAASLSGGINFAIDGVIKQTFDSSGNVGIGTTDPKKILDIVSGTSGTMRFSWPNGDSGGILLNKSDNQPNAKVWSINGRSDRFRISQLNDSESDEIVILDAIRSTGGTNSLTSVNFPNSKVGIGTAAPNATLHVRHVGQGLPATSGTSQSAGHVMRLDDDSNGVLDIGGNTGPFWLQATDKTDLSAGYNLLLNPNGGNVGIGTTSPLAKLQIVQNSATLRNQIFLDQSPGSGLDYLGYLGLNIYYNSSGVRTHASDNGRGAFILEHTASSAGNSIMTLSLLSPTLGSEGNITIYDGNVGIGTTAPTETLVVVGTANITSTLYKGTSIYSNPDIAEKMSSKEKLDFGDVVSADKNNPLHVVKSKAAYDKAVIGIVSESPTMVIGNINGTSGTEIAVVGRVKVKANDNNGNIEIGDLLTTSNEEGYAMKCKDINKCKGAIVGKSLEPLEQQKGKIWILIAMQ